MMTAIRLMIMRCILSTAHVVALSYVCSADVVKRPAGRLDG